MRSDPTIGITLGKLLSGHDPTRLDSTGISILKNRRAVDRGQGEIDSGQYTPQEVFGASGATCLYREKMLEDVKYHWNEIATEERKRREAAHDEYLDELFFAYKEDVDLSWRARLYGWKCMYTSEAVGQHFRRWGTGKRADIPKWIRRHSLKNRYLMLIKNERWDTFAPHLKNIAWYELQSVLYILFCEPYLFSVIGDIIRLWPAIMKKRKLTQEKFRQRIAAEDIVCWFI
jgi:GT2 family glycosyltransferase